MFKFRERLRIARWPTRIPNEFYMLPLGLLIFAGAVFAAVYRPEPTSAPSAVAEQSETRTAATSSPAPAPTPHQQNPAASHSHQQTAQSQPAPAESPTSEVATATLAANPVEQPPGHMKAMQAVQNAGPTKAAGSEPSPAPPISVAGDPAAGRQVFRKCQACHSMEPGKNILGPSLANVLGRKAGVGAGLQLFPCDEAGEHHLGCEDARRLSG